MDEEECTIPCQRVISILKQQQSKLAAAVALIEQAFGTRIATPPCS